MKKYHILAEKTVYQRGIFRRVQRYIKGSHPELGVLTFGLTGEETIVELDLIDYHYFSVRESKHVE